MTLLNIQQQFNEKFNIEHIKAQAENALHSYLSNHKFIQEEFSNDLELNRLRAEYCYIKIFINTVSDIPFFRVRYNIYLKDESLPKFWYEMEFDSLGEIQDDYFDLIK